MSPAHLFPNLGGEEDRDWRQLHREPSVRTWTQLWRLLFARHDVLDFLPNFDPDAGEKGAPRQDAPWTVALPPESPDEPIFPWLAGGERVVAWLPDASAEKAAQERGLPLDAPSWELVSRVHDKAFAQAFALRAGYLPRPLRELIRVFEPEELIGEQASRRLAEATAGWPDPTGGRFVLKPRFGSSARGRVSGARSTLQGADPSAREALEQGMERLARRGGAILEPWLERCADYSVQLHIDREHQLTVLGSLVQVSAASGQILAHRGELDSRGRVFTGAREEEALREAAAAAASAAAAEGFFGPCGVDAFAFRWEGGRVWLRPIVELNARFTIGTIAVGLVRRWLRSARQTLDFGPGDRVGFLLAGHLEDGAASEGRHVVPLAAPSAALRPALVFAREADDLDELERQLRAQPRRPRPSRAGAKATRG